MASNIISDHISLGLILLFGIIFVIAWRNFDFLGFWSAIIALIIITIAWFLFMD